MHGIRIGTHKAIGVLRAGLGGEIIHLVVQQNACSGSNQAHAVGEVERVGVCDRIPFASTTE